jgi:hypothetical protein
VTTFDPSILPPESSLPRVPVIDLARDSAGELAVSITAPATTFSGNTDVHTNGVLVLLDHKGQELWQRAALSRSIFGRIAFDANDHLITSGWYWAAMDIGVGALAPSNSSIGDGFLAKFDRSGHALTNVGFPSGDRMQQLLPFAVRPDDGLTVGSAIAGDFAFDGVPLQGPSSGGGTNLFLATTTP